MTYALYVYTDDAGNDWSVSVPTDIAAALSMVAAGAQPYIDDTIAPRFANFRAASGNVRQGVIKSAAQFATIIGTAITIGGVTYTGSSAKGESIGALQPNLIQPPQALMGPPGATGAQGPPGISNPQSTVLGSPVTLTLASTDYDGVAITLGVGSWLLWSLAEFSSGGGGSGTATSAIYDGSAFVVTASQFLGAGQVASQNCHSLVVVASGTKTFTQKFQANSTGFTVRSSGFAHAVPCTQMTALQVA